MQVLKPGKIIHGVQDVLRQTTGTSEFPQLLGVPQGGILSPFLFELGLDRILKANETVKEAMRLGQIIAFADDI